MAKTTPSAAAALLAELQGIDTATAIRRIWDETPPVKAYPESERALATHRDDNEGAIQRMREEIAADGTLTTYRPGPKNNDDAIQRMREEIAAENNAKLEEVRLKYRAETKRANLDPEV